VEGEVEEEEGRWMRTEGEVEEGKWSERTGGGA
jgi:hypothetical protein